MSQINLFLLIHVDDLKDVCGFHATLFHVLSLNALSVSLPKPLIGWAFVNTHTEVRRTASMHKHSN